jgi:hypothetical protein
MKTPRILLLSLLLGAGTAIPRTSTAAPSAQATAPAMEYKVVAGLKQPFQDELAAKVAQGWTPVGGISVTVWNNDLYFAQLMGRPVAQ